MFYSKAIVWNEIFLVPLILAINIDAADLLSLEKFKSFSKNGKLQIQKLKSDLLIQPISIQIKSQYLLDLWFQDIKWLSPKIEIFNSE